MKSNEQIPAGGVSCSPVEISGGSPVARALTRSDKRLRALVAATTEVIYRMSGDWSEMLVLESTGFLSSEVRPNPNWLQTYIPEDEQERVMKAIKRAISGRKRFQLEHRVLRADGSVGWTFSRAVPLTDEHGEIEEWCGAAADVTDKKRAEEALKELNETLERRVAERTAEIERQRAELRCLADEMNRIEQRERHRLAQILHDNIQQLILSAKLYVQLAGRGTHPDEVPDFLAKAERSLSEALEESRSLAVEVSPPMLHTLGLAGGLEWLALRMREQHRLSVNLRLEEDVEPPAEEKGLLIFECVRELLMNVIKHADTRETEVRLSRPSRAEIEVIVRDRGKGFDPVVVESRRPEDVSFGLLRMMQRVAHFGGRMRIESAPGNGTKVTLTVPSADECLSG